MDERPTSPHFAANMPHFAATMICNSKFRSTVIAASDLPSQEKKFFRSRIYMCEAFILLYDRHRQSINTNYPRYLNVFGYYLCYDKSSYKFLVSQITGEKKSEMREK